MSTGGAKKAGTRKIDEFLDNNAIKPFIDAGIIERVKDVIPFKNQTPCHSVSFMIEIC